MIVTEVVAPTATVVTLKLVVVAPAATVTLAGTAASALSLTNVTTAPSAGAGPFKVTVPVEEAPPEIPDGLSDSDESTGGSMVSVAVCVAPYVAVIVAEAIASTAVVPTAKLAVVAPAATVTLAGTVAVA